MCYRSFAWKTKNRITTIETIIDQFPQHEKWLTYSYSGEAYLPHSYIARWIEESVNKHIYKKTTLVFFCIYNLIKTKNSKKDTDEKRGRACFVG
ncbi:hypothetical protein P378_14850 [Desulforamulus profundi]|uniref:Uncharacterized protein n=1 Tax=Desulforamulus profundi TaxID=1383067 RepID=A0A2C6MDF0_9FIRM|nr:hypothetical protein P378_14850 [Desulforamulus profundi]